MLDLRFIREHTEEVRENLRRRQVDVDLERLLALDGQRRSVQSQLQELQRQRNDLARSLKGRKPSDEERVRGRELKAQEPEIEAQISRVAEELDVLLAALPNLCRPDVPAGADESHNQLVRSWGEPPEFEFPAKDHIELAELHDLVDFAGGAKVAGQKFYFLRNEAVLLTQGLIRFALELARSHGFTLLQTPDLARREVCRGTGFAWSGPEKQTYTIEDEDLALIGTAEVTLSGLHQGDVLDADTLPRRYCGLSHCYRMEAGAAGRSGRGLSRVHQFEKVELFAYTHPDASEAMQQEILAIEEQIFQALEVPYRVMLLCGGDASPQSARTYDIEAWMPGRSEGGSYGEVTSASTCTDYQARRLDIRFKDRGRGKNRFVHMLNGTAIALPRVLIPILENHQRADGSIAIPKAIVPYAGLDRIG